MWNSITEIEPKTRYAETVVVETEAVRKWHQGYLRYEYLRTLTPHQFKELWDRSMKDVTFDRNVDNAVKMQAFTKRAAAIRTEPTMSKAK